MNSTPQQPGPINLCGNPAHPHGPWHKASPIGRTRRERRRQRENLRAHDCICEPHVWDQMVQNFWYRCSECGAIS